MTLLLHCGSSATELCATSLLDYPSLSSHSPSRRSLLPHKLSSSYTWHCVPVLNGFRYSHLETHGRFLATPVLYMKNAESVNTHEGMCEVIWTVEADLAEGQTLYLTGEHTVLGCWEPEMAVLMSPTEEANLWKAEVQIAYGQNFKYSYFIRGEKSSLCDIIWRPGPVYSLTVPLLLDQYKKVMVRDSWIRYDNPSTLTHHAWGSLIEETYLPMQPVFSAPATDETDIDISTNCRPDFYDISDRDQPLEEPWLPHSNFSLVPEDEIDTNSSEKKETLQDEVESDFHVSLLPAEKSDLRSSEGFVSTVILINSSICTMQRVAILEDGKLVELLLEPVKSNVQSDSIYLGVVTKLVPHMGGAFVNIGNSRPSLMDIKQNREPFIYPPFCSRRKKRVRNGSVAGAQKENADVKKCEIIKPDEIEATDDGGEVNSQDDLQLMHGVDNNSMISVIANENLNGSVADYGEEDAEFEYSVDSNAPKKSDAQGKDSGNQCSGESRWPLVCKGTKIIVQVVKEGLGTKGPTLTPYPKLKSRFWILLTNCDRIGVSRKISGVERIRLKVIAKTLLPSGFGVTVRTAASGHSYEELQKDLEGLLTTWKNIVENAKSAALAADEGVEGAAPVILHRAMGQTLHVVQDYFNEEVKKMVVDSPRTYHEVTNYLQDIAPYLCNRVELHDKRIPLFDQYNIEEEINGILNKRVPLPNGGSLVIEQTEALVSIDVNGGHGMLGHGATQEKAILDVNLAAAKQIARELRLRDIGGIIVVDFIDMADESNKRLVYEEVKKAVERDRSGIKVSELSRHGLMEITRKRVRPSVTFMISEPCPCCHATGRVEALETSFMKIEQEICRSLATMSQRADPGDPKTWPMFILRVDHHMCGYLTSGKRTKLAVLSSSLKVWIIVKVARGFCRGAFELQPFEHGEETDNQHHAKVSMLRNAEAKTKRSGKNVTVFPVKKS